jgi:hypothetical protein
MCRQNLSYGSRKFSTLSLLREGEEEGCIEEDKVYK